MLRDGLEGGEYNYIVAGYMTVYYVCYYVCTVHCTMYMLREGVEGGEYNYSIAGYMTVYFVFTMCVLYIVHVKGRCRATVLLAT